MGLGENIEVFGGDLVLPPTILFGLNGWLALRVAGLDGFNGNQQAIHFMVPQDAPSRPCVVCQLSTIKSSALRRTIKNSSPCRCLVFLISGSQKGTTFCGLLETSSVSDSSHLSGLGHFNAGCPQFLVLEPPKSGSFKGHHQHLLKGRSSDRGSGIQKVRELFFGQGTHFSWV